MNTIIELFERSCEKFPENAYLWEKKDGKYSSTTYLQAKEQVLNVAAGFMGAGLEKSDRIALLSEGCNDWVYCELGVLYAGGTSVPLSIKLTEQELIFRINHSDARFVVVSEHYTDIIRKIESSLTYVEKIFIIGQTVPEEGKYKSFEALKEEGRKRRKTHAGELQARTTTVQGDDMANISYTSGTTADPKGIVLTHSNYVSNVLQSDSLVQIPEYYKILLFLPWDHSFAHTVGIYSFMYNGASLASVDFGKSSLEYLRNIPVNMKEVKPHLLLSVPAIAKNFRKNIETGIKQKGRIAENLYNTGLKLGYFYNGLGNLEKKGIKTLLYPLVKLFDGLVFSKIRESFGGNLQFFIGGGALLDTELQRYFYTLGIPMFQGYGLSEASPVISTNSPQVHRFGSSGQLVKPMDLKICDENGQEVPQGEQGEIVIRGGNVMKGYWKNEKSTSESLKNGWLYTGDMGYVNKQGLLYVLGRFKSLLIANDGEKFSPEGIEEAIAEQSPYVDYCVLYNNQSAYTSGLIIPNKSAMKSYLKRKNIEFGSIEGYKLMLAKINKELIKFRYGGEHAGLFPERWLPAVVAILPETFTEQNGTINSTTKIVRHRVLEVYRDEVEFMYTPEGKDIQNPRNTQNIRKYMEKEL